MEQCNWGRYRKEGSRSILSSLKDSSKLPRQRITRPIVNNIQYMYMKHIIYNHLSESLNMYAPIGIVDQLEWNKYKIFVCISIASECSLETRRVKSHVMLHIFYQRSREPWKLFDLCASRARRCKNILHTDKKFKIFVVKSVLIVRYSNNQMH